MSCFVHVGKKNFNIKEWVMKKLGFMAGLCLLGSLVFGLTVSLDEAIVAAVADIEGRLARGTKVAVLNFTSDAERFSDYVIGELAGALVSGNKLVVVNRQNIDLIRKEMDIQLSGDVSDESAQRIGKQLGVQSIVSGSLINTGAWFRFRVNTINVETAQQQVFTSKNINGSDAQVVFLLSGERVAQTAPAPTASTSTTQRPVTPAQATASGGQSSPGVFTREARIRDRWTYTTHWTGLPSTPRPAVFTHSS
jgi:TolB-like protein